MSDEHGEAAEAWRVTLQAWAIPQEIMDQAPADPWALPVELFEPRAAQTLTPSHQRALEALPEGGDVLDVGAGRCAMSLPLRPPARRIIAVDASPAMLDGSLADVTIPGRWPDVAEQAGRADVIVCGHVVYNVAELAPFVRALDAAARRRVVIELTSAHPRSREHERDLWRHFWGLERPVGPTWEDATAVLRDCGIEAHHQLWEAPSRIGYASFDDLVSAMRRTLCLGSARDAELRELMRQYAVERDGRWVAGAAPRAFATLWWDTSGLSP